MFGIHYLENGWRYKLGYYGALIGNGTWVLNGHMPDDVTYSKGQYLKNHERWGLGSNGHNDT